MSWLVQESSRQRLPSEAGHGRGDAGGGEGRRRACIAADGEITIHEAELFRAIADSLDCPVPPISVGKIKGT